VRRVAAPSRSGYRRAAATRARLLSAALRVFAERGYRRGPVREICRRAGVNGAMANYHFGSKERLYRAAVREAVVRLQRRAGAATDARPLRDPATARARLRERVEVHAAGLLMPRASPESLLLHREMVEPTAALDSVVDDLVRPRFESLRAAVRGLSPTASEREVTWAALSVLAQVAYHRAFGPIALRLLGERGYASCVVDELVDHVVSFSERALAGRRGAAGSVA
jgi:AcrR family transcriptional regulator